LFCRQPNDAGQLTVTFGEEHRILQRISPPYRRSA
jgi:hypothetical protein